MILAYLRNPDFIKPNYENGLKSRLREELFLKTTALDFSRDMQEIKLNVLGDFLGAASGKDARKDILDSIYDAVDRIEGIYSFEFGASRGRRIETSRERAVQLLEILNKKGIITQSADFTPEKVREIISEYKEKKTNKK